jgi:hypothetical protein
MTVDQTQFPRELEDSFDSCSYIEEYIADEYFLHKICHTLQKIIQITPKKKNQWIKRNFQESLKAALIPALT